MYITLEGSEGAGKSSAMEMIAQHLEARGDDVVRTREPGGTPMSEAIREVLIAQRDEVVDPLAETLLMFAARRQHVCQVIEPALKRGQTVLCDRFTDASRAYQGAGRGVSIEWINQLAAVVHPACDPDWTILFDVPVAQGLARAENAGSKDRFEREREDFFERVRNAYQRLAGAQPHRWSVLNAGDSIDGVRQQLRELLDVRVPL